MAIRHTNPELAELRQLVADVRSQLAQLESDYTREKSRVDAVQARLFRYLRGYYQKRGRLLIAIEYRERFLDSFIRDDTDEVEQAAKDFEEAKARLDEDYEELAAAAVKKIWLTANQEAELTQIWNQLVKLYHPGRFAGEPDELATYQKLTAAINLAKDNGDITLLREIAEEPASFLLRQGWAALDFGDRENLAQLRQLPEALQSEIAEVIDSLKQLRASPDYELCQLAEKKPGVLNELATERAKQLEFENEELEKQADELALKIKKVSATV